jgi:hypothetical protein
MSGPHERDSQPAFQFVFGARHPLLTPRRTTMQDDIDWINASSDFGLAQLCREMSDLARPFEALARKPAQRVRRTRRMTLPRTRLA